MAEIIEQALAAKLVTIAASVAGRVYPQQSPQTELRARVTYAKKQADKSGRDLAGPGALNKAVFEVNGWSNSATGYADVKAIEAALIPEDGSAGLDGAIGNWPYPGGHSVFVQACRVEDNLDQLAPPRFAEDSGTHSVSFNVTVVYEVP